MVNVTKSYLPPLDKYVEYLHGIWDRNQLTNNGPLVKELEAKLKEYLGVKHLFFVSNGTIALQIAIKALELSGDIITTPFSYVATTSSIVWEGCRPIFVDINPQTLCLNPDLIEEAITGQTTAILATHVYGHPCDVERIQAVANKHGLKVIYDAAHAFGVYYKNTSLVGFGDVSTLSFHATKLFHTVEGGAIITNNDNIAQRLEYMRNFGHRGREAFWGLGINGKNSEFHAAMGLCILPKVSFLIEKRKEISNLYNSLLSQADIDRPRCLQDTVYNYSYYPVLFKSEAQLMETCKQLNSNDIFPRRYFFPSLNTLDYVIPQNMAFSEDAAARVLCLPLYDDLDARTVELIATIICQANNEPVNAGDISPV